MEKRQRSTRDIHEIHQEEHDEALSARRVTIVGEGTVDLKVDTVAVTNALQEAVSAIEFNGPQRSGYSNEIRVVEVPKQVFVPQIETKIIEVPIQTIVTEYKVVEIERPIITESVKIVEVERPVTIEKHIFQTPAWAWALITTQAAILIGGIAYYIITTGVFNV